MTLNLGLMKILLRKLLVCRWREGIFIENKKSAEQAISTFFDKKKEQNRVQKMADGGYNRKDL